jgi:hypothetical protein
MERESLRPYADHKHGVIIIGNAAGRHHPPTQPARRDVVLQWSDVRL